MRIQVVFSSVYLSNACSDLSRPLPLCLYPPKGTVMSSSSYWLTCTVPFGGYKQSGNGRDKSLHALDKYTELKTTWLRIDAA